MLYTVGHSNHNQQDFLAMMVSVPCTIIDTRSHPTSNMEQWNGTHMQHWLRPYEWWACLGGWANRHRGLDENLLKQIDKEVNIYAYVHGHFPKQRIAADRRARGDGPEWTNLGLFDFSWFMILPEFLLSADELFTRCHTEDLTIVCCESQWWRCHRSMIADYAVWCGLDAVHLMPRMRQKNKVKFIDGVRHTKHSDVISNRLQRYDPRIIQAWQNWRTKKVK